MPDSGISMAVAEVIGHSFVLKLKTRCRLPVFQGPSVGFVLSASHLQSGGMRRHFLCALTPASCL